jgi:cytidylate kinase
MRKLLIPLDGAAGAGKTTIAAIAAQELGLDFFDTGSFYRGLTVFCRSLEIPPHNPRALGELYRTLNFRFGGPSRGYPSTVFLGDWDITDQLGLPETDQTVSLYARLPEVRQWSKAHYDRIIERSKRGVIMTGRDTNMLYKDMRSFGFQAITSAERRAARRTTQQAGTQYDQVLRDIQMRDARDRQVMEVPEGTLYLVNETNDPGDAAHVIIALGEGIRSGRNMEELQPIVDEHYQLHQQVLSALALDVNEPAAATM